MKNKAKIIITGTGRCGTTFLMRLFTRAGLDTGFSQDNLKKPRPRELSAKGENILRIAQDRFGITEYSINADGAIIFHKDGQNYVWTEKDPVSHSYVKYTKSTLSTPANEGLETWSPTLSTSIVDMPVHIIKSPFLIEKELLQAQLRAGLIIEDLIVPLRDTLEVAESRYRRSLQMKAGGFRWAPPPDLSPAGTQSADLIKAQHQALIQVEKNKWDQIMSQFQVYVKTKQLPCTYLDFNEMIADKNYLYQALEHIMNKYQISKDKFDQSYERATNLWIKGEF